MPIPGDDEIVVEVLGCTLCGSDLHSVHGRRSVATPMILGHEIVGRIVDFGVNASRVAIDGQTLEYGDRICWSLVANCGSCYYCENDLPQKCSNAMKYGHHSYQTDRDLTGGMAEHCVLVPGTRMMRIPDSMPLEVACPASCATATIAAGIEAVQSIHPTSIIILGAGMLGLTACAFARQAGVRDIVCVDRTPERRERALQFGATHAIDLSQLMMLIQDLTSGRGADAILECTGSNEAFTTGIDATRLGGSIVLIGAVFPQSPVSIVLERLVRRNLSLIGIHNYQPRHLQQAIVFLETAGTKYPFAQLVEHWFALEDFEQAIEQASNGQSIRIGLRPHKAMP